MSHLLNNTTRTKPFWRTIPRRLLPAAALGAAASLPGFRELATIADSLADILKDSPTERNRCAALEFRIRSTARLVEDIPRLRQQDVHEFATEFRAIQALFDDASRPGHRSYRNTEVKIEMLEELDRRLDNIADLIKARWLMRLQLREQIASEDSRLKEIDAYEIIDQKIIWQSDQITESSGEQLVVKISNRSGRIGNMPVTYVTYSSAQAPGEAEARVREELMSMSQFLYPNVATIVGVTRGPWLNGIVYSSAILPLDGFLRSTHDVTVLISCLRDIVATISYFRYDHTGALCGEIHVDHKGQAVVKPTRNFNAAFHDPHITTLFGVLDPVLLTLHNVYWCNTACMRISQLLDILNRLLHATGSMTMLTLYRTLHEMQVPPLSTSDGWARCTSPPPFTDLPGQVGVYQESWPGEWLSLCSDISITDLPTLYFSEDGGSERVIVTPLIVEPDGWLTYELPSGFVSIVSWESRLPFNPVVWQDIVEQWTRRPGPLSEQVELESISLCYYVDFWIDVKRETDLLDHDHVYYHRCPVACTDPRSFWGYLSTNKDPQAWNDNLENMGWKLRYGVEMHMWKLVDDWGYKYRKLLAESLRSMPGSFPTEAAETDLDEE